MTYPGQFPPQMPMMGMPMHSSNLEDDEQDEDIVDQSEVHSEVSEKPLKNASPVKKAAPAKKQKKHESPRKGEVALL